jgi:hypothetical protein
MSNNNGTTKTKRTNKHRGRRRSSEMTDKELLISAWASNA